MSAKGMGGHFYYCSELSLAAGEEAFGTASGGEVWMLVEYPLAWGTKALEMSALPDVVKAHLSSLLKAIPRSRLLLIKQQSRARKSSFSFFVVRTTEGAPSVARFELAQYEQLLRFDAATIVGAALVPGADLSAGPLFLVCTHGRRDKCCAKFGYPLFKSLKKHAGASVWQSSHVGGDRFAANLVCFPHGLFYARVTEEAGRRILGEYEGGRLVLENYRGRACYPYAVQAAEFFVRRESGLSGVDDLRLRGMTREGERVRRVRFETADGAALHEARITWGDSRFRNFITCQAAEERSVTQYALEEYRVERAASPLAPA